MWGDMNKFGETSDSIHMNSNVKMRKLVYMMTQMTMIKRFNVSKEL